ncbi:MAG: heavy metal translocating P-type ATPase metal-binding domain-containing protein, partial [Rubrivivax sp.]
GDGERWLTQVDGQLRAMCCAGCQAVGQAIEAAGLTAYYRQRSAPAAGPQAVPAALAAELALYDEPDVRASVVREATGPERAPACEATLMVEGMRCGACVWLIERALTREPGVLAAQVNYTTERATLRWDPARTGLAALLAAVARIGYRALPYDARQRQAQDALARRSLARRLFVAGLGMMQVMMYAWPAYTARAGELDPAEDALLRWASLLLTTPVVVYSAQPFFVAAWRDLKARAPGMDVPVTLGIAAAFAASAWSTVTGRGEVYFDSVTMFVFLLLGARHLEWLARRRAGRAVDSLAAALEAGSAHPLAACRCRRRAIFARTRAGASRAWSTARPCAWARPHGAASGPAARGASTTTPRSGWWRATGLGPASGSPIRCATTRRPPCGPCRTQACAFIC